MSSTRRLGVGLGWALAAMVAAGCNSKSPPEDIGVARLELTSIPSDVNCLRLNAVGARTVVQQFDVTPGSDATLLVTGLPTGTVVITGYGFAASCSAAGDVTTANWISDPVTLEVSTTDIVDLSLVMHRNGRIRIGVDFKEDVRPTCKDGIQNGTETGIDCGGSCPACPTCKDGIQNGNETGVDCGGSCPRVCGARSCIRDENCMPGEICVRETCTPNPQCSDGIQNGTETGVDCGGNCVACPTCKDGIQNGDETGVDCGGSCPRACGARSCIRDENCMPGEMCVHMTCQPGPSCTLPAGAVAWWRADGDALDSIGGHDGVLVGNVSFVPGEINTGFGFDGLTSAYVNVFTAPDLDFTSGFTIDAWININGSVGNSGRIVDKIHTFSNDGFLLDVAGGHLRVIGGGVGLAAADPIATDVFRHVVAVFDANRIALFVNGTLAALAPTNGAMVPTNGLPVRIGADSDGGSDFPGIIDEVRLFNRGLTDDEARLLFQQYSSCPR